jgi:hypothetical protein
MKMAYLSDSIGSEKSLNYKQKLMSVIPIKSFLSCLYLLLLVFISDLVLAQSSFNQHVLDSILNLAVKSKVQVYDSKLKPIPFDTIHNRYCKFDTIINDHWTRPFFLDNIFQSAFDGIKHSKHHNLFVYKEGKRHYEIFEAPYSFPEGFIDTFFAFNYKKKSTLIDSQKLTKTIVSQYKIESVISKSELDLITSDSTCWRITSLSLDTNGFQIDSCHMKYELHLSQNHKFYQSYQGDSFCSTPFMEDDVSIGVEGDLSRWFFYSRKIQYCKIENLTGYWKSTQNKLQFISEAGHTIYVFDIKSVNSDYMELQLGKYIIRLHKESL